jgi:hypothetical protein
MYPHASAGEPATLAQKRKKKSLDVHKRSITHNIHVKKKRIKVRLE